MFGRHGPSGNQFLVTIEREHLIDDVGRNTFGAQLGSQGARSARMGRHAVGDPRAGKGLVVEITQSFEPLERFGDDIVADVLTAKAPYHFGTTARTNRQEAQRNLQRPIECCGTLDLRYPTLGQWLTDLDRELSHAGQAQRDPRHPIPLDSHDITAGRMRDETGNSLHRIRHAHRSLLIWHSLPRVRMNTGLARHPVRSRRLRTVLLSGMGLVALASGATLTVLMLAIEHQARTDDRRPADALLVLGAAQHNGRPSRAFRARLDHAATLYQQGYASLIVLVGGTAASDEPTEAEVGARYLRQRGIPMDHLLVVPEGRNTWESLAAAAPKLQLRGVQRLLIVSDGFHLFRSELMARRLGFEAYGSPAPSSPIRPGSTIERWYILREAIASLAFLLGRR